MFKRILPAAAFAVMSVAAAYGASVFPHGDVVEPISMSLTDARDRFDDAPMGVDPMVTGPVSAAFREKQERLGCAEAKWPNIPAACYPD